MDKKLNTFSCIEKRKEISDDSQRRSVVRVSVEGFFFFKRKSCVSVALKSCVVSSLIHLSV